MIKSNLKRILQYEISKDIQRYKIFDITFKFFGGLQIKEEHTHTHTRNTFIWIENGNNVDRNVKREK